jgi:antitoxin VapB
MSLNLKSGEAHRLARELADVTGESMTTAVIEAMRERLDRLKRGSEDEFVERILAIGRDCAAHLSPEFRSRNPDDLLYGEDGLPRDC